MEKQYFHLFTTFVICIFTCFAFSTFSFAQSKNDKKEIKEFQKTENKLFNVKLRNKQVSEKIYFKLHQDWVIIPVTINGKTYNFIFDTGVSISIFSDSLAKSLNSTYSVSLPAIDADGIDKTVDFYYTDSVQFGSLCFDNVGYGVVNLDVFQKHTCMRIDGFLGVNIFNLLNWEIDFSNQIINVSNNPFSPNNYSMEIPFKESLSRVPTIKMKMGKYIFYATLDIGNNDLTRIPDSLFFTHRESSYLKYAKGEGKNLETLFNDETPKKQYISEIDSCYIGNNLIINEMVTITQSPSILIGNSFLKKYEKITINWKQKKIFLGIKSENNSIDNNKFWEFVPNLQDDKLIVSFIWENTDAYKKGIRIGDQIMSVNGISTEKIDVSKWCEIGEEIENYLEDNKDNMILELLNSAGEKVIINIKKVTYKSLLED
jgi:hypothetical protein